MTYLWSSYNSYNIINLILISMYYDTISAVMSSSCNRILSCSTVIVLFITLHHTESDKTLLILGECYTGTVPDFNNGVFHIACIYSLPEQDSLITYPLAVSLGLFSMEGTSHIYKTRLLASPQIVNEAIFPAFVLRYSSSILVSHCWLICKPPLIHAISNYSVVPKWPTLIVYELKTLISKHNLFIQYASQLETVSCCRLTRPEAIA